MPEATEQRGPKFRRRAEARPDEVLDGAGLSKGAVYLYFPSKESIIEGLVKRAVSPIADNALGMLRNYAGDPRPVLSAALKMVARRLSDPQLIAIPRLLIREMINFPELAQMYRREVLDRIIPTVIELIRTGVAEGYFRKVDPELTLRSLIGPNCSPAIISEKPMTAFSGVRNS